MAKLYFGLVVLLFPALVLGQSLADVAREEKERREGNRKRGEKAQLVIGDIGARGEGGDVPSPALVGTTSAPEPTEEAVPSTRSSMQADRAQQEIEWRRRQSEARQRLAEARKQYELLSKLHLTTGSYYVDASNEPVITSVEQLQGMVASAKAELESATEALSQLREDARRAGVPPGWVR